ncbi:MAG: hypothetical protein ACRDA9_11520 [Plesiomonas shigelloides]
MQNQNQEQAMNMVSPLIYIGGTDAEGQPVQIVSAQLILDVERQMVGITVGQYDDVQEKQLIPFDGMPLNNFQRASIEDALKVVTQAIKLSVNNYIRVLIERGAEIDEMGEHFLEHMSSVMYLESEDIASENLVGAIGELQDNLRHLIAFGQTKQQMAAARRPRVMPAVRQANSPTVHSQVAQAQPTAHATPVVPEPSAAASELVDEPLDEQHGFLLSELMEEAKRNNQARIPDMTSPTTTAAGMPIVQAEQAPVAEQAPAVKQPHGKRKPGVTVQTI